MKTESWYLKWTPDSDEYLHDDALVAIALKSKTERIAIADVLQWVGQPTKAFGNEEEGSVVYFYDWDDHAAMMYDVVNGFIVSFGVINRDSNNASRKDPETGKDIHFNIVDEMEEFETSAFRKLIT